MHQHTADCYYVPDWCPSAPMPPKPEPTLSEIKTQLEEKQTELNAQIERLKSEERLITSALAVLESVK